MASKRHLRKKSCGSKQRHKTKEEAIVHILRLKKLFKGPEKLDVYKCKFCGFWHVGHKHLTF